MNCWSCGTELLADSNFCHKCGARVRGAHGEPSTEAAPPEGPGSQAAEEETEAVVSGDLPHALPPEREVWVGRPNIWSLAGRFTFAGFCFVAIIVGITVLKMKWEPLRRSAGWWNFVWAVALMVLIGLGVWLLISIAKTKLTLKYKLTSERLVIEHGCLSKRSEEMDLVRVDDATVHQGLFDRLANVGNIVISSNEPTDPLYIVVGVKQPVELKEKLRQHARELRRRSLRTNLPQAPGRDPMRP